MKRVRETALRKAYVPEHLVDYVEAVSGAEAYLRDGFLVYRRGDTLTLVGYPLNRQSSDRVLERVLRKALRDFAPRELNLIGERLPPCPKGFSLVAEGRDDYFFLELNGFRVPSAAASMVRRALREVSCEHGRTFGAEHRELLEEFLSTRPLEEGTRSIMERIPDVMAKAPLTIVIGARGRGGRLVAFDVADFSGEWAFYMFNVTSRRRTVPGASDLLLHEVIGLAAAQGKRYLNLGLGINEGVAFFKKKWGAVPFLPYRYGRYRRERTGVLDMLLERF